MRRLAILFVALAAANTLETVASSGSVCQAPRRVGRALMSLVAWKKFLIGPLRLTASNLSSRLLGGVN